MTISGVEWMFTMEEISIYDYRENADTMRLLNVSGQCVNIIGTTAQGDAFIYIYHLRPEILSATSGRGAPWPKCG